MCYFYIRMSLLLEKHKAVNFKTTFEDIANGYIIVGRVSRDGLTKAIIHCHDANPIPFIHMA